jgi:biotin operon repressor
MRKRSRIVTLDDVKYVYENYATTPAEEIARKLGITRAQVYKIARELKKRGVNISKKRIDVYGEFIKPLK